MSELAPLNQNLFSFGDSSFISREIKKSPESIEKRLKLL